MSGTNSYQGGTVVSAGTLVVASAAALPAGGSLTVGDVSLFPSLAKAAAANVSTGNAGNDASTAGGDGITAPLAAAIPCQSRPCRQRSQTRGGGVRGERRLDFTLLPSPFSLRPSFYRFGRRQQLFTRLLQRLPQPGVHLTIAIYRRGASGANACDMARAAPVPRRPHASAARFWLELNSADDLDQAALGDPAARAVDEYFAKFG